MRPPHRRPYRRGHLLPTGSSTAEREDLMAKRLRYLSGLAALAAAGVCILGAGTAGAATSFGSMDAAILRHRVRLQAKVLVNIPLTVTCAPLVSTNGTLVEVDVEQGTDGLVARGSGSIPSVVCDNTAYTYQVPVLARWSDTAQLPA